MDIISTIYAHAVALSALAVVALHQALKFKWIPWAFFNKYPVPGLILLSAGASAVVSWQTDVQPQSWTDWLVLGATIAVTSAITYLATVKNWREVRAMEGAEVK